MDGTYRLIDPDRTVRSPEALMTFAAEGHLPKGTLASVLKPEYRRAYLEACANIEKQYTEDCAAQNDPCLESGCSVVGVEGESCLQPLLRASLAYHKACAAEWMKIFRNPHARIDW